MSGDGKNPSEQGALTNWRVRTDGHGRTSRTWKESERARGTHRLESADRRTCQDVERIRASKGHSPTGERGRTDVEKHGKNPSELGALTNWRAQTDGHVRTWKESERVRGTCRLESTDGWTYQDLERIRASKGYSLTGERRRTDMSGHGKNPSEQGALTDWRVRTDGRVRTWKESERARGTHRLESADGRMSGDGKNPSK